MARARAADVMLRPDADGRAIVEARIARTGVQQYGDHAELRLPEEVFDAASLASFVGAPVTVGHVAWIDDANVERYSVGFIRSVRRDGNFIAAVIVITDAATIAKLESGALREWSAGYLTDNEERRGTYEGETYHQIQRNIRANHVAALPPGGARCGTACSVTSLST